MNIGKMRDRITVFRAVSDVVDTNTIVDFEKVTKVWGYVKPTAGRQFFEAAAVNAERLATVIVRYDKRIIESGRLEWDGVTHRIESVVDIENRHKYMEIKCEVVVSGG